MHDNSELHMHDARKHRMISDAYGASAEKHALIAQGLPHGDEFLKHRDAWEQNHLLRLHHAELSTHARRKAEGLDPETGNPRIF